MSNSYNWQDILSAGENVHTEFKAAYSKFPQDALETISAFANTDGGKIFLGITENDGNFELTGVNSPKRMIEDIFTTLNNKTRISRNPITEKDIDIAYIDEASQKGIVILSVPRADYRNKPIFLHENPASCYYRQGSSDFKCTHEMYEAMVRDSSHTPYDSQGLKNYGIDDFDTETIQKYRTQFENLHPEHPFNKMSDKDFLCKISALTRDRENGEFVATVAGLLVFGTHTSIREHIPHYNVEYIYKSPETANSGYKDRLIYDGSWGEDNLYNFFFSTFEKLKLTIQDTSQISSDDLTRKSFSKMRIALREALANAIIHCDYVAQKGILIIRYSDQIIFANGGNLRISKEDFYSGGNSSVRNPFIQEIFRHINICEKAGSGVPKIMDAVQEYHLKYPALTTTPNTFELKLWDTSIVEYGETGDQKQILEYIVAHKTITIMDVARLLQIHRNTASKKLNELVQSKILESRTINGTKYFAISQKEEFRKYDLTNALFSSINELTRTR